jgi:pimeloyl-ACP methyl ester carboxylesterase
MKTVRSKDGTAIAYDKVGSGPALILVDGALCSRGFGPMPKLSALLAKHFTVYLYDRRGRGESGDTQPYSRQREVEDLAALIELAGGSPYVAPCVAGLSSGAALALEAAAGGLAIKKVAAFEPPFIAAAGDHSQAGHEGAVSKLIAAGKRGDAVKYFMRMVRVPGFVIFMMQLMPNVWPKLKAAAHTLPYDMAVMGDFTVPAARIASIRVPTLVMDGEKTQPRLQNAVDEIVRALPSAQRRTLKGQTHNVSADVVTPELVRFFAA